MAVGAYRHQVAVNIKMIIWTHQRYWHDMVHLDVILSNLPVKLTEVKTADRAYISLVQEAQYPVDRIPLVPRRNHESSLALIVRQVIRQAGTCVFDVQQCQHQRNGTIHAVLYDVSLHLYGLKLRQRNLCHAKAEWTPLFRPFRRP